MALPNRGGIYASRGFAYQDYTLIDSIFCFIDENNFRGIEVESDNDYEIINQNISVQVKIGKEKLSEISEVITNLPDNKDKYLLYFSQLDNKARNFFTNVNDFGSNISKLSDNEIINKLKIDKKDIYKVRRCKIKILPALNSENYVCGIISKWLSKHQTNSDIVGILNTLLLLARKARTSQSIISKRDVLEVICDQKYIPNFTQSLDLINYLLGFKSDIINCINFFINEVEVSIQLEQLKLLIIDNNYAALKLVNRLAKNNPNYWILKDATYFLFGKKPLDNSTNVEPIAGLENFYRLVKGIKYFIDENYKLSKNEFKKLTNTNINTNIGFLLGLTLFNLQDYENAILVMQRAIKGESNRVRSHGLTMIYMCKKAQNFFYNDLDELTAARQLNPSNQLAILLELEHYTDFKEFEEAIFTFDYLKIDKLTKEEKIGAYMTLVVSEYHLKSKRLHSDMIEFLNLLRDNYPQKSMKFYYIGMDYIESFTLIFRNNIYTFSIGNYTVQVPMQEKVAVRIGIDITPCFAYATLQLEDMVKNKVNKLTNAFILKYGSPTIFLFINKKKELIRILKQKCLTINHKYTREYLCKDANDILIRVYLHQSYVTGDLRIGNFSMGFSINKKGRSTREFQKLYFSNPSDFLIELIDLHNKQVNKFYITVPLESVNVEFE